jgi:hypothetical protein
VASSDCQIQKRTWWLLPGAVLLPGSIYGEVVTIAPVSPEFLSFANHADGLNPVAAVKATTGAFVGRAELLIRDRKFHKSRLRRGRLATVEEAPFAQLHAQHL